MSSLRGAGAAYPSSSFARKPPPVDVKNAGELHELSSPISVESSNSMRTFFGRSSSKHLSSRGGFGFGMNRKIRSRPSQASSLKRLGPAITNTPTAPISPPAEERLKLMPKIAEFRRKGWISNRQEREMMNKLIDQNKSNPFDNKMYHQLKKTLLDIEKERGLPKEQEMVQFASSKNRPHTDEDQVDDKENRAGSAIYQPQELAAAGISEQELEELFCEMCFFARLGFLQPPSCLECVYRESIEGRPPNVKCSNKVVWRRNARELLHPDHLENNLVVIECQSVRKLTNKETVGSHQWDKVKRELVEN